MSEYSDDISVIKPIDDLVAAKASARWRSTFRNARPHAASAAHILFSFIASPLLRFPLIEFQMTVWSNSKKLVQRRFLRAQLRCGERFQQLSRAPST